MKTFAVAVLVTVAVYYLVLMYIIGFTGRAIIDGGGIRPMIEELWCGSPGCLEK